MKVLFIGGTGIISSASSQLCLDRGIDLYLLNRGTSKRPTPAGAKVLTGDINDLESARSALGGHDFDVVVNWVAFVPNQVQANIDLFRGRTGQYVFISSASAYQTPPSHLPVTESTPLENPYWQYSRNKIACEELLLKTFREEKFPFTVVRPSHTYDRTLLPFGHGTTVFQRMLHGKPVVVHGDGTSLWTLTHHADFAKGFVGLLGHQGAVNDFFHITSDEWLTWNQIYDLVAKAAGTTARKVWVPSDAIWRHNSDWGDGLLGDKANCMIFDNSKVKRLVPDFTCTIPFARGAEEIVRYHLDNPSLLTVDPAMDALEDKLAALYGAVN